MAGVEPALMVVSCQLLRLLVFHILRGTGRNRTAAHPTHFVADCESRTTYSKLPVCSNYSGFPYLPFFAKLVGYLPKESLLSSGRMTMFFPKNNYILFVHRATLHEAPHIKPIYVSLNTCACARQAVCPRLSLSFPAPTPKGAGKWEKGQA